MTEQLSEAAFLLAMGMAVVFVFLTLLIAGIKCIATFVRLFPGEVERQIHKPSQSVPELPSSSKIPNHHIAAITAAIHQHHSHQRRLK